MWGFVANILGGPIVKGLLDAYQKKLDAGNTSERIAADLAAREIAAQEAESSARIQLRIAQVGHWWEPEHLFGYTLWIYFAKCILWDKVLGLGSTDALTGAIDQWAGLIIMTYFGKRTFENVARIIKR